MWHLRAIIAGISGSRFRIGQFDLGLQPAVHLVSAGKELLVRDQVNGGTSAA
jgi:hypothetical protein